MIMACAAYKAKKFKGREAATAIIIGFTGQWKSWWDNFVSEDKRSQIINHTYTKQKEDGTEVQEDDGPEILIHAVTFHFFRKPWRRTSFLQNSPYQSKMSNLDGL